jgi:hypothetical protein
MINIKCQNVEGTVMTDARYRIRDICVLQAVRILRHGRRLAEESGPACRQTGSPRQIGYEGTNKDK